VRLLVLIRVLVGLLMGCSHQYDHASYLRHASKQIFSCGWKPVTVRITHSLRDEEDTRTRYTRQSNVTRFGQTFFPQRSFHEVSTLRTQR